MVEEDQHDRECNLILSTNCDSLHVGAYWYLYVTEPAVTARLCVERFLKSDTDDKGKRFPIRHFQFRLNSACL